jgi:hypothetical protein
MENNTFLYTHFCTWKSTENYYNTVLSIPPNNCPYKLAIVNPLYSDPVLSEKMAQLNDIASALETKFRKSPGKNSL